MIDIKEIQKNIYSLGSKIGAPPDYLILRILSIGDGSPRFECTDDEEIHRIYEERGVEIQRKIFSDVEDFLYEFFNDVCMKMARSYELENRADGSSDPRRIAFPMAVALIQKISGEWAEKLRKELNEILRLDPYLDGAWKLDLV